MSIALALIGASGRAGKEVLRALPDFPDFHLCAAVVSPRSQKLGAVCLDASSNQGCEVKYSADIESAVRDADVVIEFCGCEGSLAVAKCCAEFGKPVVIASTGHSSEQLALLRLLAGRTALLLASNLSLGVFALRQACAQVQKILGAAFEIEIVELHHKHKKDAPSGTALTLASDLAATDGLEVITNRGGVREERSHRSLGVASLRGGEVLGEHTVYFFGAGERLEFTHRTSDRGIYARGGLRALQSLLKRPPGFYELADLLR